MPEPKYLEKLEGKIGLLDRKIDTFNEKFDQKVDALSENLHKVEIALTTVTTSLDAFIKRIDKTGDRQWGLFVTTLVVLVGAIGTAATSIWQIQQQSKQLEKLEKSAENIAGVEKSVEKIAGLESAINRLNESVTRIPNLEQQIGKLERSVEKIAGLEATIVRLDQSVTQHGKQLEVLGGAITRLDGSVARIPSLEQQIGKLEKSVEKIGGLETTIVRLDQSLALHGRQLEKLEKSVDKFAGLEIAITRLDGSVTRLANLERTLPELAGSIRENLALSRAIERRLEVLARSASPRNRAFTLDLDLAEREPGSSPDELTFKWHLEPPDAYRVEPGQSVRIVLPSIFQTDPVFAKKLVVNAEIVREGEQKVLRLRVKFPDSTTTEAARKLLTDRASDHMILVEPAPVPPH